MDADDHKKTPSWGNGNAAKAYRDMQVGLIKKFGKAGFRKAMLEDIMFLRKEFGSKYRSAIIQMIAYAKCMGQI